MRAVIDTNVLVSAAVTPRGVAAAVLFLATDRKIELFISPFIVSELEDVLSRPKIGFSPDKIRAAVAEINEIARVVHPKAEVDVISAHSADNRILECAVEAKADVIVTGDLKHIRPLGSFEGIEILTPREFMGKYFPAA